VAINNNDKFSFLNKLKEKPAKIGYAVAGTAGLVLFGAGIYNGAQAGNLKETTRSIFNSDTGKAALATLAGAAILCGVGNKMWRPHDTNAQETTNNLILGGAVLGSIVLLWSSLDSDSNASTDSVKNTSSTIAPPHTSTGQTIVSAPPGMCEINIPYKSNDEPSVLLMQTSLFEKGFYKGPIDGINGGDTRHALRDFKTANGFDTATSFNQQMCEALSPLLVDGDKQTPTIAKAGN
jgi:hypothetical protein